MRKTIITIIASSFVFPLSCYALTCGVMSDIHAGNKSTRKSGTSIVYPKKAVSYFKKAVKAMKKQGVELIISLGDNTQLGGSKYYKQLKKVENKYKIKVLWVKGNHDDKNFKYLSQPTYFYDKGETRFIVLDTTLCKSKAYGCLDQSQVDFLNLNKTDNTIILQHHPPLVPKTCEFRNDFIAEEGMRVFSGHFHTEMNCGNTRVFPALTEHKKLTYQIIDL